MKNNEESAMQIMHFHLSGMIACINLQNLIKVILLPLLEPVPESFPWLAGLMNLEGQSVPVIDLAMRLNISKMQKYTLETPILLCKLDAGFIGLIVGEVIGIANISTHDIQHNEKLKHQDRIIQGSILYDSRLSQLINLKYVLDMEKGLMTTYKTEITT